MKQYVPISNDVGETSSISIKAICIALSVGYRSVTFPSLCQTVILSKTNF